MPSSPGYVRDYQREYAIETPARRKARAERHKARRMMEKKVGKAALKGKDVDHIKPLSKGGSNSMSNLALQDLNSNRSYPRTKTGKMKSKRD